MVLTRATRRALAQLAGVAEENLRVELRRPLAIQTNHLYDIWASSEHWVAKEFVVPGVRQACAEREQNALELLASLDLAPQPVTWFPGDNYPLVVYRYLEGEMWDRRSPSPADLERLLLVLIQIHCLPTHGLWASNIAAGLLDPSCERIQEALQAYAEWAEAVFPPAQPAAQQCLRLLERLRPAVAELARLGAEPRFCKLDPRFANLIDRPDGRLGLVDWEDSGLRDPALELADLTLHPNQEDLASPQTWMDFLQAYAARAPYRDPDLLYRVKLYQAMFPLFWLSVLTRHGMRLTDNGELAGWRANEMELNQRLRRYVAHGKAWLKGDFNDHLEDAGELVFFQQL